MESSEDILAEFVWHFLKRFPKILVTPFLLQTYLVFYKAYEWQLLVELDLYLG